MEKLLIYPYDAESAPLIRHKGLLEPKYCVESIVSLSGWGFVNKDAGTVDGGNDVNLTVKSNFQVEAQKCEAILLVNSVFGLDFKEFFLDEISKVHNKSIVCIKTLNKMEKQQLKEICNKSNNKLKFFSSVYNYTQSLKLVSTNVPVVFVLGGGERSDKFEIQLSIRQELLNMGYKITQIGSKIGSELFGFHSYPSFLNSNRLNDAQKVLYLNQYIKHLESVEKPDLIIIGIPGGTMPICDDIYNNFGIWCYLISQAIKPDYAILSSYLEKYNEKYFDIMNNAIEAKFGYSVDCFNISNNRIDWAMTNALKEVSMVTANTGFVTSLIEKYGCTKYPVLNIQSIRAGTFIANDIIEKLSSYSKTVSL